MEVGDPGLYFEVEGPRVYIIIQRLEDPGLYYYMEVVGSRNKKVLGVGIHIIIASAICKCSSVHVYTCNTFGEHSNLISQKYTQPVNVCDVTTLHGLWCAFLFKKIKIKIKIKEQTGIFPK